MSQPGPVASPRPATPSDARALLADMRNGKQLDLGRLLDLQRHPVTGEPISPELYLRINYEVERHDIRDAAKAIIAERSYSPTPPAVSLQVALDQAPEPEPSRIERILPVNCRAILTAPKKMGKSTLTANVVKAVTTGGLLFDRWRCRQGRVLVLNYEVLAEQWARWCADTGVPLDDTYVLSLRGQPNPLASARGRRELVAQIRDLDIDMLIVDPYGAAINGIVDEERDNSQARAFTGLLDELTAAAGVTELLVPAHAGKVGEDGRGASALEDWPDAIWRLVGDENGNRYFTALGRDIDVPEEMLQFNPQNRRLSFPARPVNRANAGYHRGAELALEHIAHNPGCTVGAITEVLEAAEVPGVGKSGTVGAWMKRLAKEARVVQVPGPKNSKLHYLPGEVPR